MSRFLKHALTRWLPEVSCNKLHFSINLTFCLGGCYSSYMSWCAMCIYVFFFASLPCWLKQWLRQGNFERKQRLSNACLSVLVALADQPVILNHGAFAKLLTKKWQNHKKPTWATSKQVKTKHTAWQCCSFFQSPPKKKKHVKKKIYIYIIYYDIITSRNVTTELHQDQAKPPNPHLELDPQAPETISVLLDHFKGPQTRLLMLHLGRNLGRIGRMFCLKKIPLANDPFRKKKLLK